MSRTSWGLAAIAAVSAIALPACAPDDAGSAENEAAGTESGTVSLVSDEIADMTVKVYKSPACGCCEAWVEHLRAAGFEVEVEDTNALAAVKAEQGVPAALQSCHTAVVGDYVFEGHVPVEDMVSFLQEAPDARGLAVPGMPVGSPGMEQGDRVDPYDVIMFDESGSRVYRSHR